MKQSISATGRGHARRSFFPGLCRLLLILIVILTLPLLPTPGLTTAHAETRTQDPAPLVASSLQSPLSDQQMLSLLEELLALTGKTDTAKAAALIMAAVTQKPQLAADIQALGVKAGYDQEAVAEIIIRGLVTHPSTQAARTERPLATTAQTSE